MNVQWYSHDLGSDNSDTRPQTLRCSNDCDVSLACDQSPHECPFESSALRAGMALTGRFQWRAAVLRGTHPRCTVRKSIQYPPLQRHPPGQHPAQRPRAVPSLHRNHGLVQQCGERQGERQEPGRPAFPSRQPERSARTYTHLLLSMANRKALSPPDRSCLGPDLKTTGNNHPPLHRGVTSSCASGRREGGGAWRVEGGGCRGRWQRREATLEGVEVEHSVLQAPRRVCHRNCAVPAHSTKAHRQVLPSAHKTSSIEV